MKDFNMFLVLSTLSIAIKLLLLPSKFSTDFEVHRNWMAITSNMPIQMWYTEKDSIWTLDYPPFFAYFEMILGLLAKYLFPHSTFWLQTSHNNSEFECRLFQKISVIVSDLFMYFALYCRMKKMSSKTSKVALFILLLLPSLLIIDHMHFQYNGFLIGLFLFCAHAFYQGKLIIGSVLFITLVCFKHIFIVFAPVFGSFVLISTLMESSGSFYDLLIISYSCIKVMLIAFLPFLLKGVIYEIISRLFPVQRGLLHSYWAPNFWALYSAFDLILRRFFILKPNIYQKLFKSLDIPPSTLCNGLTGEKRFSILPNITPAMTLILIGILHMPIIYGLTRNRSSVNLIKSAVISGSISFLFGYHVHEKASIPLIALALYFYDIFDTYSQEKINYLILASTIALIPLMQSQIETLIAVCLVAILYFALNNHRSKAVFSVLLQVIYVILYIFLKYFRSKHDFLPLITISVPSALIIMISSTKLYLREIIQRNKN